MVSIKGKIIVGRGLSLLVTLASVVTFSTHQLRDRALDAAVLRLQDTGASEARKVARVFHEALATLTTLAESFQAVKEDEAGLEINREVFQSIFRKALAQDPCILAIFTCWEPDAFVDLDEEFEGKPGHDETGRFISYWSRGDVARCSSSRWSTMSRREAGTSTCCPGRL